MLGAIKLKNVKCDVATVKILLMILKNADPQNFIHKNDRQMGSLGALAVQNGYRGDLKNCINLITGLIHYMESS